MTNLRDKIQEDMSSLIETARNLSMSLTSTLAQIRDCQALIVRLESSRNYEIMPEPYKNTAIVYHGKGRPPKGMVLPSKSNLSNALDKLELAADEKRRLATMLILRTDGYTNDQEPVEDNTIIAWQQSDRSFKDTLSRLTIVSAFRCGVKTAFSKHRTQDTGRSAPFAGKRLLSKLATDNENIFSAYIDADSTLWFLQEKTSKTGVTTYILREDRR